MGVCECEYWRKILSLKHRAFNLHHHRIPELVEGLLAFFVLVQPRAKMKGSPSTSSGIRRVLADSDVSLAALATEARHKLNVS
jgi:hypothetical protein